MDLSVQGLWVDVGPLHPLLLVSMVVAYLLVIAVLMVLSKLLLPRHDWAYCGLFLLCVLVGTCVAPAFLDLSYNLLIERASGVGAGDLGFLVAITPPFLAGITVVFLLTRRPRKRVPRPMGPAARRGS